MEARFESIINGPFKTDFIVVEDENDYGYVEIFTIPLFKAKEIFDTIKNTELDKFSIETRWGNLMPSGDWVTFETEMEAWEAIREFFKEN